MKCDQNQSVAVVASVLTDAAQKKSSRTEVYLMSQYGLQSAGTRVIYRQYQFAVNSRLIKVTNRNPFSMIFIPSIGYYISFRCMYLYQSKSLLSGKTTGSGMTLREKRQGLYYDGKRMKLKEMNRIYQHVFINDMYGYNLV